VRGGQRRHPSDEGQLVIYGRLHVREPTTGVKVLAAVVTDIERHGDRIPDTRR
jgi:hypothetical protein